MRKIIPLLFAPLMAACTVSGGYFYAPFRVEMGDKAPVAVENGFLVIENLNAPHDCRVIPAETMYPAIYRVAFGPASQRAARAWAEANCATRRRGAAAR